MSAIELNNTFAGFKKLKNDLTRMTQIFSYTSMFLFAIYYVYLIIKNIESPLYLVIYSVLFLVILASFIVEVSLRESKKEDRKSKRIVIENKRKAKAIIKIPKYLVKGLLVGFAIYETATNFDLGLSNIFNISLAILLVLQVITDIVVHYITYYVDYLSRCIEQDIKQSGLIQFFAKFNVKKQVSEFLEDKSYKIDGESKYTAQEQKIYKKIEAGKKELKEEKKQETDASIKRSFNKLFGAGKDKIKKFVSKSKKKNGDAK